MGCVHGKGVPNLRGQRRPCDVEKQEWNTDGRDKCQGTYLADLPLE